MTPHPLPADTLARIKELLAKDPHKINAELFCILRNNAKALIYRLEAAEERAERAEAAAFNEMLLTRNLMAKIEAAEARAAAAEAALDRYRYAIHWMAADAWDAERSGGEARARCEWARGEDRGSNLDNNHIAIIGQAFLATTGRARAALTANPKDTEGER